MSYTMPRPVPARVTHDVAMRILLSDGAQAPMLCSMEYSIGDPYAVSATFRTHAGDVTWVFARDLIADAMTGRSGEGDIVIKPLQFGADRELQWTLSSPSGRAVLTGPCTEFQRFLDATVDLVPLGGEWQHIDMDAVLSHLMDPAGPTGA